MLYQSIGLSQGRAWKEVFLRSSGGSASPPDTPKASPAPSSSALDSPAPPSPTSSAASSTQ